MRRCLICGSALLKSEPNFRCGKCATYWLIHEPGKKSGFATVPLDAADTPSQAVRFWHDGLDDAHRELFEGLRVTARRVTKP